jgi:hypothetical protein
MNITEKIAACRLQATRQFVEVYGPRRQALPFDALGDEADKIIFELTSSPLLLPKPERRLLLYVISAPLSVYGPNVALLEEREMLERAAYIYLPPEMLRLGRRNLELRYILTRGLLRASRPDPRPDAVAFEEALALFVSSQDEPRTEGEPKVLIGESLDSPRNTSGATALLEYIWMEKGSHILPLLWAKGSEGLVTAVENTLALPAGELLRRFFLWACGHGLLETADDPSALEGVLDHASYWLGQPTPGAVLELARGRNGTSLLAYLVSQPGGASPWKHAPSELPNRPWKDGGDSLLVMNCGHRTRGSFPCHDGARWRVERQ